MEPNPVRRIGPVGTLSRVAVGLFMLGGAIAMPANVSAWLLGALAMPGILILWQRARVRRDPTPIRATGPAGHFMTAFAFLALYLTPSYASGLSATSGAALIFFGGSMLVAAARGYRGCEVLAASNWILGRDDQVGCVLFSPIDRIESANGPANAHADISDTRGGGT